MRIIKVGRKPETIEYEGECRECKTVFAYTKNEAEFHLDSSCRGEDYYSVNCPHLGKNVNVYPNKNSEVQDGPRYESYAEFMGH
jgi:hypothetical protein